MKEIKLQRDELGEVYDEEGACIMAPIDRKASVKEVLEAVNYFMEHSGMKIVVGDDHQDNAVWFKIDGLFDDEKISGTVTNKKCECCEHHEVGIENDAGEFIPLKSGMKIQIVEE
jgi:hypothetical protein